MESWKKIDYATILVTQYYVPIHTCISIIYSVLKYICTATVYNQTNMKWPAYIRKFSITVKDNENL